MEQKYALSKERLDWLSAKVNRSKHQTDFLFNLVDGDFKKLLQLEMQLYNCYVGYCPGDKEDVEEVMKLVPKKQHLVLEEPDFFFEKVEENETFNVDNILKIKYSPHEKSYFLISKSKEIYSFKNLTPSKLKWNNFFRKIFGMKKKYLINNKTVLKKINSSYWEEFDVIYWIEKLK